MIFNTNVDNDFNKMYIHNTVRLKVKRPALEQFSIEAKVRDHFDLLFPLKDSFKFSLELLSV